MINIIKRTFHILKNNLIFIQPLLFCLLGFLLAATFVVTKNVYPIGKISLALSLLLLFLTFSAGWFHINKYGVINYNKDDSQDEITVKAVDNFKKFFEGVGENFLKISTGYIITFILSSIFIYTVSKFCYSTLGEPKIIYEIPKLAQATSQAEILNFVNNIPEHDKLVFVCWMLISNIVTFIISFFTILYMAVLNFEKTNLFVSLLQTIKFFYKNFLYSIFTMFFIFALYLALNFVSLLLGTNSFSLVILIILSAIYLNYYVLLVFCLYYDKTKDNSNNRTEFIG